MSEINERQKMFCHELLLTKFNQTQAAINAGYSKKTAKVQASRLLTNVNVKKYLTKIVNEDLESKRDTLRHKVIAELEAIAFSNVTDDIKIVRKEIEVPVRGSKGKTQKVTTEIVEFVETKNSRNKKAIASIGRNAKGYIEVKYYDKPRALEMLGRYLEMFTDKIDLVGDIIIHADADDDKL